jgi:hypothetical protein
MLLAKKFSYKTQWRKFNQPKESKPDTHFMRKAGRMFLFCLASPRATCTAARIPSPTRKWHQFSSGDISTPRSFIQHVVSNCARDPKEDAATKWLYYFTVGGLFFFSHTESATFFEWISVLTWLRYASLGNLIATNFSMRITLPSHRAGGNINAGVLVNH